MQQDIRALQEDLTAASKDISEQRAQVDEQLTSLQERNKEVSRTLQDLNRAARMTDADFGVQLEELRREVQELRGQIELLGYRLSKIEPQMEGEGSLVSRVEALETQQPKRATPAPLPEGAPKDKKGLLDHAKKLSKQGKVDEARGVFREIIRQWPKDLGAADEARFQLGELYLKEKKYRSALQEYIKIAEDFEKSDLVGDAYYRIAICSMELGDYESSEVFFKEVLKLKKKKGYLIKPAKAKLREVHRRLEAEKKKKKR